VIDAFKSVRIIFGSCGLLFEEDSKTLSFWEYGFEDYLKYDSIFLIKSEKYQLIS